MLAHTLAMAISTLSIHSTILEYLEENSEQMIYNIPMGLPSIVDLLDEGIVLLPERHLDLLRLYCVLKSWKKIYDEFEETL